MKGATEQQRQEWKMPHDQRFSWLPNTEKTLEGEFVIILNISLKYYSP